MQYHGMPKTICSFNLQYKTNKQTSEQSRYLQFDAVEEGMGVEVALKATAISCISGAHAFKLCCAGSGVRVLLLCEFGKLLFPTAM